MRRPRSRRLQAFLFSFFIAISLVAAHGVSTAATATAADATAATAAAETGNVYTGPGRDAGHPTNPSGGHTGGETIESAIEIPSIPFLDSGSTCDYANDYDEVCPLGGSTAPDVVYRYTPDTDRSITIDLCASLYDTKVYVYEESPEILVGCNDDAGCGYNGWQSRIEDLALTAGVTYYIVVDGYGTDCGEYALKVREYVACIAECPPGALLEDEPPCGDGYEDTYNSGCNLDGWFDVEGQDGGCAVICGQSCTYELYQLQHRDTDWYRLRARGGTVTATCDAEFPVRFLLIYTADCGDLRYVETTAEPCEVATLEYGFSPGEEFWLWVAPRTFDGIPESGYRLEVCGIEGGEPPSATRMVSWGQVKSLYR